MDLPTTPSPADPTRPPGSGPPPSRRRPRRQRSASPPDGARQTFAVQPQPPAAQADDADAGPVPPEPSMLDIDGALAEILGTPAATIHRAAAYRWASRAVAGYRVCAARPGVEDGLAFLYLGEHYREAALAHAAMGEAWQPLYAEIDAAMAGDRAAAFTSMRRRAASAGR